MAFESITDIKIKELLACRKQITNPDAKGITKDGNLQVNYKAESSDDSGYKFEIYKRQNLREGMEDDFSCGISWFAPNGEKLTLKRYNGSSHTHLNHIEGERLGYKSHIHLARENYIRAGKKPDGYAEMTDRYKNIDGALDCLVSDCNITGLKVDRGLFDNQ
ncbi:MAG: hypothetical protein HQL06_05015 [Nitrospirae bacterium]|nr:hypothetical protein [Nitrospirota bacterium]